MGDHFYIMATQADIKKRKNILLLEVTSFWGFLKVFLCWIQQIPNVTAIRKWTLIFSSSVNFFSSVLILFIINTSFLFHFFIFWIFENKQVWFLCLYRNFKKDENYFKVKPNIKSNKDNNNNPKIKIWIFHILFCKSQGSLNNSN